MKVYLFHSDWYDICWYEDPIIKVYTSKEMALQKLEKERKLFIQSNEIQDWIEYDDPESKRWSKKDMQCDMYITEHEVEKWNKWRPKWIKQKEKSNVDPYSLSQQIINIKPWQYYYTRAEDKTVSWILATNKMSWQWFRTERVIVVHLKTWDTERWVLVSRDEAKSYSKITKETADRNFRDRSNWKYVARTQWYYEYNGKYIAIDNRTNEFFMEEFDTKEDCFNYLNEC